jgi:hypothetical protein
MTAVIINIDKARRERAFRKLRDKMNADERIALYRNSLVAFAEECYQIELSPWQRKVLHFMEERR